MQGAALSYFHVCFAQNTIQKTDIITKKKFLFISLLQILRQNAIIQLSLGNVTDNVTGNGAENVSE